MRHDYHDGFGSVSTYRLAPGVKWGPTTLRGSLGTGFKTPSLYQRFSTYGDPNLKPERSLSYDIGLEQEIKKIEGSISLTAFHLRVRSLIDFYSPINRYINLGDVTSDGLEASLSTRIRLVEFRSSYTYTEAKEKATDLPLVRRPRHQLSAEVTKVFLRWRGSLRGNYVGARDDLHAITAARVRMPAHAVFFLNTDYRASSSLRFLARIENLFDRVYEEVHGYGTPRRSYFLGLQYEI